MFYPSIRTKNYSVKGIKGKTSGLSPQRLRSIVRLGSLTSTERAFPKSFGRRKIVEINTTEAIENSRSKIRMKEAFDEAEISHSRWQLIDKPLNKDIFNYPLIIKRVFGFKGRGMLFIESEEEFQDAIKSISPENYIVETYHNYNREYRLHCTLEGCFYTCRKMLKETAENRWMRNDSNCAWMLEDNPLFNKPINWNIIEEHCIRGLKATGLDIGAFDVKVQSAKTKEGEIISQPKFIIIEVNSAPAFGDVTAIKYKAALNNLISKKIDNIL